MKLTFAQFRHVFPKAAIETCVLLNLTLEDYSLDTVPRVAAFLAQVGHECAGLTRLVENLNYSAEGLAKTWPARYAAPGGKPNAIAIRLAHNPEAIANNCYANRMGNGNEATGDGWRYRGRGAFMTTGKSGYADTAKAICIHCLERPELLEQEANALEAAGWFWSRYALNRKIDQGDFKGTTQIINGGQNGAADRQLRYDELLNYLGAPL